MKPREWSVYIVRCADASLYTGIAKDVSARLGAHNAGRGAAYTRARRPVDLVYRENDLTRSAALTREARIKALERAAKLSLIKKAGRVLAAAALLLCAGSARAAPAFDKENPVVFSSAAPQAFAEVTPGVPYPARMYFIRQSTGTEVGSATSADGVAWVEEAGARLSTSTPPSVSASSITAASVLPLTGGGFRMLYSIVSTTGAYRVHSATSADGFSWANDTGTRLEFSGGAVYLASPKLVKLTDGNWRAYYVRDQTGGANPANGQIYTCLSTNEGLAWGASSVVVSTLAYEVGAALLTDGRVRLFFTQPLSGASSATVVSSALSTDALASSFALETGYRLSTSAVSGTLSFPAPVRSTDSFRWRLYYDFAEPGTLSTAAIHTALTGAPAPASMNPGTVLRTNGATSLTILGEVFSAVAPVAKLSQAGQPDLLTTGPLTRTNDQSLDAVFNLFGLNTGFWDLTLTNADGAATTLVNALYVDYPGGALTLTNNLLRPSNGVPTSIDVTTFNAGRVLARVYSLDGRLVRTLYDGDRAEGSFSLSWDGRDAVGGAVASGLYILRLTAPKLDAKSKIVVIR
ncbi:MAG TPA: hypothetical protein DCZ01_08455 [Elusimicrobia bacterium]|nr:MAG: hypothetical protein A2X37_08135 [Elusimicrobia bacterium GWA2_66_18]HAZ08533.1 hypothetical protein [Elusimicrobiota bacterium]